MSNVKGIPSNHPIIYTIIPPFFLFLFLALHNRILLKLSKNCSRITNLGYNTYMTQNRYEGIIWTHHALSRLNERGLSQDMAFQTFRNADTSFPGKKTSTIEYRKQFGKSTVTVIATQNEKYEWIILSCWIDPPLYGTHDHKKREAYNRFKKASFWGKLWLTFKSQLGF